MISKKKKKREKENTKINTILEGFSSKIHFSKVSFHFHDDK